MAWIISPIFLEMFLEFRNKNLEYLQSMEARELVTDELINKGVKIKGFRWLYPTKEYFPNNLQRSDWKTELELWVYEWILFFSLLYGRDWDPAYSAETDTQNFIKAREHVDTLVETHLGFTRNKTTIMTLLKSVDTLNPLSSFCFTQARWNESMLFITLKLLNSDNIDDGYELGEREFGMYTEDPKRWVWGGLIVDSNSAENEFATLDLYEYLKSKLKTEVILQRSLNYPEGLL
jgi:hypothetical protein